MEARTLHISSSISDQHHSGDFNKHTGMKSPDRIFISRWCTRIAATPVWLCLFAIAALLEFNEAVSRLEWFLVIVLYLLAFIPWPLRKHTSQD